jgi:predicted short-subunit dehydrogenase-like oxidoreductase (DUF2520 family)
MLEDGLQASLTGPVERCDISTIHKHLDSFSKGEDEKSFTREDEKMLYKLLSRKIVPIAEARHPERSYEEIKGLLK